MNALSSNILITSGMSDDRTRIALAHEIAHATCFEQQDKSEIKRKRFGNEDHSTGAGIMNPTTGATSFSPYELKVLRGIEVTG